MRLAAAALVLVALAGCERPLVDPLDRTVEVVGVDLGEVRTDSTLDLGLRVQGATALTVDGESAVLGAAPGLFSRTLTLARGVNRIAVRASDANGVVVTDTLVALYLPVVNDDRLAFPLPSPRSEAAVVAVPPNRVLVTGGVGLNGAALATMAVLVPSGARFSGTDVPLLAARAGHTASVLPDGGVLLIGGATAETPTRASELVRTVEWIPPGQVQSQAVVLTDGEPQRAGHTARVLDAGGRTLVYLYGGLVQAGAGVAPSGSVDIFEWLPGETSLVRLSPAGGAGAFAAVAGHVQIPLTGGTGAAGVVTDAVFGGDLASRLVYTAPGSNYPFDLAARSAAPLSAPRIDAAGTPLALDGLALVVGGRGADGVPLGSAEVYAGSVDRTFRVPASGRLIVPRSRAGATLLPDGRIIVAGGRTAAGAVSNVVEVFSY